MTDSNHLPKEVDSRIWVQEINSGLEFAALREEWTNLMARSNAGPFLAWNWLYPWWRRIAPERRLRLLAARNERGQLEAILPLCEKRERSGLVSIHRWGFLGDSQVGSDYLDLVAAQGQEPFMARLFAEHLASRLERIDVLELLDLPENSILAQSIMERLEDAAFRVEKKRRYMCPLIEIKGEYASYLRTIGRAQNLARREKWLVAQPGFTISVVHQPDQVRHALADFFELHRLRWASEGGSQGIESQEVRSFHRDAALLAAQENSLKLYTLSVSGRPLASIYGLVHKDRFFFYQSGYDPEWARRSVGLVLLGRVVADAFRKKMRTFEFLRGCEPYKLEWANAQHHTEMLRLIRPTVGGAAYLAQYETTEAVKGAAKQLVGPRIWQQAQRWRRRRQNTSLS